MLKKAFSFDKIIRITSIIIAFFLLSLILFYVNFTGFGLIPAESLQKVAAIGTIGFMLVVTFTLLLSSKNHD